MGNIDILIMDGCTKFEAKRHLERGSVVFIESDLMDNFDDYMEEWDVDEDGQNKIMEMIKTKRPIEDWGVVEMDGNVYFIMYVL